MDILNSKKMSPILGLTGFGGGAVSFAVAGGAPAEPWHVDSRFTLHDTGTSPHWIVGREQDHLTDADENSMASVSNNNNPGAGYVWSAVGLGIGNGVLTVKTYGDGGNPCTIVAVHSGGTVSATQTGGTGTVSLGSIGTLISLSTTRFEQGLMHAFYIDGTHIYDPNL